MACCVAFVLRLLAVLAVLRLLVAIV